MQDGYLGFVPHETSSKHWLFSGEVPQRFMQGIPTQSLWTWVINAVILIVVVLIV
jgi:hypothetical protein